MENPLEKQRENELEKEIEGGAELNLTAAVALAAGIRPGSRASGSKVFFFLRDGG
jgi:hypothetical protein